MTYIFPAAIPRCSAISLENSTLTTARRCALTVATAAAGPRSRNHSGCAANDAVDRDDGRQVQRQ
jgi:hypothetical protein